MSKWICSKDSTAWPLGSEPSTYEPYRPYLWAQGTAISSVKMCNLRAAIETGALTSPVEIIRTAGEIDDELNEALDKMSRVWSYDTVQLGGPSPDCFEGFVHIHQSLAKALLWNNVHCIRVLLQDIILHYCGELNLASMSFEEKHELLPQYERSISQLRRSCSDICASVPYIVGTVPQSLQPIRERPFKATDGLGLLWSLFVVCDSPFVENNIRMWTIGRLNYINYSMGIRQAGLMADTLFAEAPDVQLPRQSLSRRSLTVV